MATDADTAARTCQEVGNAASTRCRMVQLVDTGPGTRARTFLVVVTEELTAPTLPTSQV